MIEFQIELGHDLYFIRKWRKEMEKKAFVTKEMIEEIVKDYPTPFHIYDE